jgi:hypothetical protein
MQIQLLLSKDDPKYVELAASLRGAMQSGDTRVVAELISGLIQGEIEIEDPVAPILGEFKWAEEQEGNQVFEAPYEVIGNTVTTMENGMTLRTAKLVQNRTTAPIERIVTAEFPVDSMDLQKGNLVTLARIENEAKKALVIQKANRLYQLLCEGARMTDPDATNSRVLVVEDDGTYSDASDNPSYVRVLKRLIEDQVSVLQEVVGGGATIKGFCRQITADLLKRVEVSGVEWYVFPAAVEHETKRPFITEGDIVLVAPYAANVGEVEPIEGQTYQPSMFEMSFAWRWGHKWVRWDDKYLRRIVVVKVKTPGTIELDAFSATEMDLYFSKPVRANTIKAAITVSAVGESGSTAVTGAVDTVTVGHDLRHVHVTFAASKLTAGSSYDVAVAGGDTGVKDIVTGTNHDFTALSVKGIVA